MIFAKWNACGEFAAGEGRVVGHVSHEGKVHAILITGDSYVHIPLSELKSIEQLSKKKYRKRQRQK